MLFSEVIGQEQIKQQLVRMVEENRVPHALLFCGPEGCGKLPMAIAFATYLLCTDRKADDACGVCSSCRMAAKVAHPDLHFCFPVIKPKNQRGEPTSDQFIVEWRQQLATSAYFDRLTWLGQMGVDNQQSLINVAQSNEILQKLSLKANQGGYKVMVIWLPEQMNEPAANKLLKLLEEPPEKTVFILVCEQPEQLLATIVSRTQRIDFRPLPELLIAQRLQTVHGLSADDAVRVAHTAEGSLTKALQTIVYNKDSGVFFDMFVLLMRLSYMRKIKDMHEWGEQVASWGRERQKNFLIYCQKLIRENFIYNFHRPEMNYMEQNETDFSKNFARFVNERNVIGIMDELSQAQRDIEQNVNPKMVFFDFALKMIVLLIQ